MKTNNIGCWVQIDSFDFENYQEDLNTWLDEVEKVLEND